MKCKEIYDTTGSHWLYAIEEIAPALYRPMPGIFAIMSWALLGNNPSYSLMIFWAPARRRAARE